MIARLAEQDPTLYSWNYNREQDVLTAWKEQVYGNSEGDPCLCNDATLSTGGTTANLVFYGIALDALTAATAAAM